MIDLLVLVCLAKEPDLCQNLLVAQHQCMMQGQSSALSKWMEKHPGWRISRWRCGVAQQIR